MKVVIFITRIYHGARNTATWLCKKEFFVQLFDKKSEFTCHRENDIYFFLLENWIFEFIVNVGHNYLNTWGFEEFLNKNYQPDFPLNIWDKQYDSQYSCPNIYFLRIWVYFLEKMLVYVWRTIHGRNVRFRKMSNHY